MTTRVLSPAVAFAPSFLNSVRKARPLRPERLIRSERRSLSAMICESELRKRRSSACTWNLDGMNDPACSSGIFDGAVKVALDVRAASASNFLMRSLVAGQGVWKLYFPPSSFSPETNRTAAMESTAILPLGRRTALFSSRVT